MTNKEPVPSGAGFLLLVDDDDTVGLVQQWTPEEEQ